MLELNPLDVLKIRELDSVPPHFSKIRISNSDQYDYQILTWIRNKLKGRFYLSSFPEINENNHLSVATYAGFEEQKELTYFMLACPYLRRN